MALTLNATLDTAQDNNIRKPIVNLTSESLLQDIPMLGTVLSGNTMEYQPSTAFLSSSGRLVMGYQYDDDIVLKISDTDISYFSTYTPNLVSDYGTISYGPSFVEIDSDYFGVVYIEPYSRTYVQYAIISISDGTISSFGTIAKLWLFDEMAWDFALTKLANGTYIVMVASADSGGAANFRFHKHTSTDFTTWSDGGSVTIPGMPSDQKMDHPFLFQIDTGDLFLYFDSVDDISSGGDELTNIYFSISSDNGVTWSNAVKITNFTDYGAVAIHPEAVQKVTGEQTLVYTKVTGALRIERSQFSFSGLDQVNHIAFDAANRKLYIPVTYNKVLNKILKWDIDTWSLDDYWDGGTVPAINGYFLNNYVWYFANDSGDSYYIALHTAKSIMLLNGEANTITYYNFYDNAFYGLSTNVTWTPVNSDSGTAEIMRTQFDPSTGRIYIMFGNSFLYATWWSIGYIDINAAPDGYGNAVFNVICSEDFPSSITSQVIMIGLSGGDVGQFRVFPESDMIVASSAQSASFLTRGGWLRIYTLSTGDIYKTYSGDAGHYPEAYNSSFPFLGFRGVCISDGILYGNFYYYDSVRDQNFRGLAAVNLTTDIVQYYVPTFNTLNDYGLWRIDDIGDNRLLIGGVFGVELYNKLSNVWTHYDNSTIPGMTENGDDGYHMAIAFDSANDMVFAGHTADESFTTLLTAFYLDGNLKQTQYVPANFTTSWEFGSENPFLLNYSDYDTTIALDSAGTLFAFWEKEDYFADTVVIKWAKEEPPYDLSDLLVKGTDITVKRSIDGSLNELSFTVANGHLFDHTNLSSLNAQYLKKGRMLVLKFGEEISEVNYWQDQGTFFVVETKMKYKKGSYPVLTVRAEDKRNLWNLHEVNVTECYSALPQSVLEDIVETHGGLTSGEMSIPVFDDGFLINHQWLDTNLKDIVEELCNRFQYFSRMDVDNIFTIRKIDTEVAADHIYSDNTKLIDYSSEDSYSDFVNKIVVTGEEELPIEILHDEERIATLNGSIGWWGHAEDFDVHFSPDDSRNCKNARLVVKETATSIAFKLAGSVTESISYIDPDNKYCIVTVNAPNLIPILAGGIAIYAAGVVVGDISLPSGGMTIPLGRILESTGLLIIMQVLGSIANFQYEIWGNPVGEVNRTVQGEANDFDLQNEISMVVENQIEGFLCYTVNHCETIAEFEMLLKMLQRKRIKLSKVAHLQDEEGDIIQVPHPYSGMETKVYVTDIQRKMKIAADSGYFIDNIEGWII